MTGIILRLLAGVLMGSFYFGGLWYTVRGMAGVRHPALLVAGSFSLRTLVVLAALVPLIGSRWENAAAAMVGFFIGRKVVELCT